MRGKLISTLQVALIVSETGFANDPNPYFFDLEATGPLNEPVSKKLNPDGLCVATGKVQISYTS